MVRVCASPLRCVWLLVYASLCLCALVMVCASRWPRTWLFLQVVARLALSLRFPWPLRCLSLPVVWPSPLR